MSKLTIDIGTVANDGTGDPGRTAFDSVNKNFTELYNVSLNSSGTVNGTDQLFTGHIAVGGDASVSATQILVVDETIEAQQPVTAVEFTVGVENTSVVGTAAVAHSLVAVNLQEPSLVEVAQLFGIRAETKQSATADMLNMYDTYGVNSSTIGSGNITLDAAVFHAASPSFVGGKPANSIGTDLLNQGVSGITNAYGSRIAKQSGATNNYGIALLGDDVGADIAFGASQDIRQHFNGSNLELEGIGIDATTAITTETLSTYFTLTINGTDYKIPTVA